MRPTEKLRLEILSVVGRSGRLNDLTSNGVERLKLRDPIPRRWNQTSSGDSGKKQGLGLLDT